MTAPAALRHLRRSSSRRRHGDLLPALAFVLPATFGFVAFYIWPTVRGFYFSLTDYSLLGPARFVGVDNYKQMIDDRLFWNALLVTAEYVLINIVTQTVLALLIAVLMHRLTRSIVVRGIIMLPYFVANVVVAIVWYWMLDPQIGVINELLNAVGVDRLSFFGDTAAAMPTVALLNTWRHVGYTALLIVAGMQMIPRTFYEAAALDGASEWRMFWRVTLPLLRPVMALVLVLTVIGSFQVFDTVAVTTSGGPVNATRVIVYYIYDQAFNRFHFGFASAMSFAVFVLLVGIAYVQLRLTRAHDSDLS
ncbi:sugar ABC transporter permease [Micromonospora sp. B11E3]|uniref:carbohydrate ABC transporter permease n=1 Tax=Micromonospora sp. B11E3 TaxID=3153562 RepID=UPI00325C750E